MSDETSIGKKTIRDVDVSGKRVLVRADLNVPLDEGKVADDTRITASLPTMNDLCERGAKVILCSHLGRPKGKPNAEFSLRPVADRLGELVEYPVRFVEDCVGPEVETAIEGLGEGEIVVLENLRFHAEEEANDDGFAKQLASLADIYVNDAFGAAHRAHASTAGVAAHLPAVAGLLLEREVRYLGALVADPPRPFAAISGGAKVSSKTAALDNLLPKLDLLLVGGGMANTFLAATGLEVGRSLVEDDQVEAAKGILDDARARGIEVVLPVDAVVAESIEGDDEPEMVDVREVPADKMILDIGTRTLDLFREKLSPVQAVVWNGPMGVFEVPKFSRGSSGLARIIAALDGTTVVGGGETAAVVARAGVTDRITHVSTGGGASLEMLEGKELPGVAALNDA